MSVFNGNSAYYCIGTSDLTRNDGVLLQRWQITKCMICFMTISNGESAYYHAGNSDLIRNDGLTPQRWQIIKCMICFMAVSNGNSAYYRTGNIDLIRNDGRVDVHMTSYFNSVLLKRDLSTCRSYLWDSIPSFLYPSMQSRFAQIYFPKAPFLYLSV